MNRERVDTRAARCVRQIASGAEQIADDAFVCRFVRRSAKAGIGSHGLKCIEEINTIGAAVSMEATNWPST